MNPINNLIPKLLNNKNLSISETEEVFKFLTSGKASDVEMAAFLATLSMKGVSSDELVGATKSLFPHIINPLKLQINTINPIMRIFAAIKYLVFGTTLDEI